MFVPAVGFHEFGGPDVLQIVRVPLVTPGPGRVRVQVRAAPVNPTDTLYRSGALHQGGDVEWPLVPGMDFAGVVSAVGADSRWSVGDEVVGVTSPWAGPVAGAYSSHVVVDDDNLGRKPEEASFAEASTLLMNGLTALQAVDRLALPEGAVVGISGAAGAVGGYAIGLAKARGLRVVADASAADAALVSELGADVVIERGEGVADRFVEAAGGRLDGLVDAALQGPVLLPAVRDGGAIAALRAPDWEGERDIAVHFVTVPTYYGDRGKIDDLVLRVERGELRLRVAQVFAPEHASEAHRLLEQGGTRGRLVLEWPTA